MKATLTDQEMRQYEKWAYRSANLTEKERRRFSLWAAHGISKAEIARREKVSIASVSACLWSAFKKLVGIGSTFGLIDLLIPKPEIKTVPRTPCAFCGGKVTNRQCTECGVTYPPALRRPRRKKAKQVTYNGSSKYETIKEWAKACLSDADVEAWRKREQRIGLDDDLDGGVMRPINGYRRVKTMGMVFSNRIFTSYFRSADPVNDWEE